MTGLKKNIRGKAFELGFDDVGFTRAALDGTVAQNLSGFLAGGLQGDMDWLARHQDRRADPQALWPEARSVVVLAVNYGPDSDPLAVHGQAERGAVSVYARNRDYHDLVKKRLKHLARWMVESCGGDVKVFVDTAPVMEKPLAQQAGIGWQGKHTNLVSRRFGSWLFLGEVFTTLEITPDQPEADHCGSCDRCMRACPTDALTEAYRIDPRRCISYLTIEHKDDIKPSLMEKMGNHIYGCDDCLAACPWTKYSTPAREEKLRARPDLEAPLLAGLAELDDSAFRGFFSGSPVKRTGRDRFLRNVLIAIGNSADPSLDGIARKLEKDPSSLVRRTAAWAHRRLSEKNR